MSYSILIDFGSTFTKAVVVDRSERTVRQTFRTPSTVGTDASIGLRKCLDAIRDCIGPSALAEKNPLPPQQQQLQMALIAIHSQHHFPRSPALLS